MLYNMFLEWFRRILNCQFATKSLNLYRQTYILLPLKILKITKWLIFNMLVLYNC